ncbi:cysteine methyltransferase [Pseudidiomarina salinarum]|uniref:Methylated-DNA--protein-cysteine methyltransferase n=1 Tax=Pseudidiomarina salinarum TaxID=435908 RepID=A0A094JDB6_9GAMM|nr:methylated-DNA--[protein]-cysteine S-methyltransferase [Pseudidiomarina salinarum]KFZ30566.1 cysteine methyltransferase [Pseudidiomarina salinarum]RUO69076.1 cysteine methyltransferase [Pseudidiomarina salinarum]
MYQASLDSPLGPVTVCSDGEAICQVSFDQSGATGKTSCTVLDRALEQLEAYFQGRLQQFDLPLRPRGTAFQQQVWQQLNTIGFGKLASYGDIARAIQNPKGVRAVGMANSRNPLGIIIPCHRVIGSNGTLTGYAGGLDKKVWLLRHEGSWQK